MAWSILTLSQRDCRPCQPILRNGFHLRQILSGYCHGRCVVILKKWIRIIEHVFVCRRVQVINPVENMKCALIRINFIQIRVIKSLLFIAQFETIHLTHGDESLVITWVSFIFPVRLFTISQINIFPII
jgi:hypothetical protein